MSMALTDTTRLVLRHRLLRHPYLSYGLHIICIIYAWYLSNTLHIWIYFSDAQTGCLVDACFQLLQLDYQINTARLLL